MGGRDEAFVASFAEDVGAPFEAAAFAGAGFLFLAAGSWERATGIIPEQTSANAAAADIEALKYFCTSPPLTRSLGC